MTAKELYSKTMPFNMAKLALGLATVALSTILFAILMGIGWLFGDNGMGLAFILWISGTGVIRFVLMHYMGYLVKAGHVAVLTTAVATGQIPADQVAVGKAMVTERFATSNIYFAVDALVAGAVRQLQGVLDKVSNTLDFIPGIKAVAGVGELFIGIALGYIDECCLGWTFYKKDQGAFQSAADGVVIYAQNGKYLLGEAAKTTGMVLLATGGATLVSFIVFGGIFKLLGWSPLVAFLLACLAAWTVKFAFIDSWILVKMMVSYMQVAPQTPITYDLYSKLCSLSSKFRELFSKGQAEGPRPAHAAAGAAPQAGYAPAQTAAAPLQQASSESPAAKPVFCGQCGAKSEPGTKFCAGCGARLE